jgi:glucan phosphoethanolaminetransferase (alkaline phosphatase superfamily)
MDSVKTNTPPPEINKCNVLYKDQEFYSKSVKNNEYKEYTNLDDDYSYSFLSSSIILTIICFILIYNARIKYKENKSILLYIIFIIILFMCIMCSSFIMLTSLASDGFNYITKPSDLTRPCYSSRINGILYTDEQLMDIYNNK